jgi:hypothetical protein
LKKARLDGVLKVLNLLTDEDSGCIPKQKHLKVQF